MESGNGFDASAAYYLDPGNQDLAYHDSGYRHLGTPTESPVIMALPGGNCDLSSMMQFCRRVCPGAPLLVTNVALLHRPTSAGNAPSMSMMADRLAAIIHDAIQVHDLALVPIIVVGNAAGADLAICLGLAHGELLAACILLRPIKAASPEHNRALHGVHVLIVQDFTKQANEGRIRDIAEVLQQAGAEIICERVPDAHTLGAAETAIARVFVAALFRA